MTQRFVVIGAGVAGLAAARALKLGAPNAEVVLLERSERIGGLVLTERTPDGFLLEHGPDSLLEGKPAGMRAIAETGISDEVVSAPAGVRKSFVAREGRLYPLPPGLISGRASATAMMTAPLFTMAGRARMAMEPFMPQRAGTDDESVASFFERRFGQEMVDRLIEPVFRGVYTTPTTKLSVRAVMPHLAMLEQKYGSLARAMASRASLSGSDSPAAPTVVTLRSGMGALPTALARALEGSIRLGVTATRLRRTPSGLTISLGEHGELEANGVVVATPAPAAARLLADLDPAVADSLGAIGVGRLDTVTFGFWRKDLDHPLEGTGFVVDANEKCALTACTWSSSKWVGRAPDDSALIRCFLAAPGATDEELVASARDDLRALMGIPLAIKPRFTRVWRLSQSLPRYEVGYMERAAETLERVAQLPDVAVAGNAYNGMGVPDCIASGLAAAARLLGTTEPAAPPAH